MNHLVVIGDLIQSRRSTNRQLLQTQLKTVLAQINAQVPLLSPYTLTLGDEFQAVLTSADGVFHQLTTILQAIHPIKARFALGVGEITTPINPTQALAMDGPAFYGAREGIDQLKKNGELFALINQQSPLPTQALINPTLDLLSHQIKKWKANRLEIFNRLNSGQDIKTIAKSLAISDKAVYKNISEGAIETVMDSMTAIEQQINTQL